MTGAGPLRGDVSAGLRRQTRLRAVFIAAAAITWLFTVICVIGVAFDGASDARLGFVILGVPFLAAALACTYGARNVGSREQGGAGEILRVAQGGDALVRVARPEELSLDHLPGETSSVLEAMRRSYGQLDAKLADQERGTEAWKTMTQIVRSIVPTTVNTYRDVAGYDDADTEFGRAVQLLGQTFEERRTVVTRAMLDDLHTETRYIQDRFTPSELTVDNPHPESE